MGELKHVILTTEYRGVFFGILAEFNETANTAVLKEARNVIYWDAKCRGFAGLAVHGPLGDTRLGAQVPEIKLMAVTSIIPCTAEAVAKFAAAK